MNEVALTPHFQALIPYAIIVASVWLTYAYTLRCSFVSDDLLGIASYDGKLQGKEYGMISRWVRYHICGGNFPSKLKDNKGNPVPLGKNPRRHHVLSTVVFTITSLLGYCALSNIIGSKLALMSILFLIVHPVTTQGVAWISGLGYPLCLLWMFASLCLLQWYSTCNISWAWMLVYPLFTIVQYLAVNALFVGIMFWAVLLLLGYWPFAIISALVSLYLGTRIVKQTIDLRKNEFKKQNMAHSIFLKPRKLIVATKTLYYYVRLILFPHKLGLYHKWGYHYTAEVEREDSMFVTGLAVIGFLVYALLTQDFIVQFGIIWFLAFISIFLNWITIQQFVTERYSMIPALGIGIVVSYYTQYCLPLYAFIIGALLIRTLQHLPTYDDEIRFYQSNIWNFPDSEVAYGNHGVTCLRAGLVGTAIDLWMIATRVNPDYDVPHYNLFSHFKANADMQTRNGNYQYAHQLYSQALPHIQNCLKCSVIHFKEQWQAEHDEIAKAVQDPLAIVRGEEIRLKKLKDELSVRKDEGALQSIRDIEGRLKHIEIIYEDSKRGVHPQ